MSTNQLEYYISLAAPPTRKPAAESATRVRAVAGFNPSWFTKNCDIDFSERYHEDAEYRLQCYNKMKETIMTKFPGRDIGGILSQDKPDLITGVYGTVAIEAILGRKIKYYKDKWPVAEGAPLSDDEVDRLKAPDLENNEFMKKLFNQMDEVYKLTGDMRGFVNWQGVLNGAFRMRGQEIFMDLYDEPERAMNIFQCMTDIIINGTKLVQKKQALAGNHYTFGNIGNCTANMVSPEIYEKYIFPYDLKIRQAFDNFAIHNCAWSVDKLADMYSKVDCLGYIDMGMETDLTTIKEKMPNARRNVLYKSIELLKKSDKEIKEDIEYIASCIGPCDISFPDIENDVPDEKIELVYRVCDDINDKKSKFVSKVMNTN